MTIETLCAGNVKEILHQQHNEAMIVVRDFGEKTCDNVVLAFSIKSSNMMMEFLKVLTSLSVGSPFLNSISAMGMEGGSIVP